MTLLTRTTIATALALGTASGAAAQTAEEIVERHLAAMGGRTAMDKLISRTMIGTVTVTIDAGDLTGPIELTYARPNKVRTLINLDLSAFGADKMVYDERFDGSSGFLIDTMQGNRDIIGNQLHNLRNETFPTPLLDYKRQGASLALEGKEKIGDREAYVLILTPQIGPAIRRFIDAESYLETRIVTSTESPSIGPFELTIDLGDYRDVDGVKVPFHAKGTSNAQNFTVIVTRTVHNQPLDASVFSKPPQ